MNNYLFSKIEFIFNFEIMYIFHMSSEIIHSAVYDNYDDFQDVNFLFSQNFISLF